MLHMLQTCADHRWGTPRHWWHWVIVYQPPGDVTSHYSCTNEHSEIIYKDSYKLNFDLRLIDHVYDPLIRANHLIETVKMLKLKNIALEQQSDSDSQTYYVIHPVLKHVAIKKGMQICGLE